MIIGGCPYSDCDELHLEGYEGPTPRFQHATCHGCHRTYWLLHSRIDPQAYTEADFAEQYVLDEATKQISPKPLSRQV